MSQKAYHNITKYIAYSLVGATLVSAFLLLNLKGAIAAEEHVATASVTVSATCSMTANVNTAHTATVVNGTYTQNIGQTTIKTFCNDPSGYAIYAIGFSGDKYGNTDMIGVGLDASYNIKTGTATNGNDGDVSNWAMKIGAVAGDYTPTVENGFGNFSAVPSEYTKVASFNGITDAQTTNVGSSITTTYAAYIANAQPAGTYTGQVKYALVHPSGAEAPDPSPKLTFDANGGTFAGGATTNVLEYSVPEVTHGTYTKNASYPAGRTDNTDSQSHGSNVDDTQTITIFNATSLLVKLYYETESNYDFVYVYEGASASGTQIAKVSGGSKTSPTTYNITGDSVTFKFTSDSATNKWGYWAEVTGEGDEIAQDLISGTYIDKPAERSGYAFLGWATTPNATTPDYIYDPDAPVMENTTVYAAWKNCNAIGTSIASITYLQQFDYICMAGSMTTGTAYTLKDNRDSTTYHVSKLADGKVWMLDNLALGGDSAIDLTTADTNIAENWTLPASGTDNFTTETGYTNAAININSKDTPQTQVSGSLGSGNIGVYYNYCAASAGTYCYASNSSTGNAEHDICPKGWRMPTGGASGEYQALYTAYSSNATNFKKALSLPLSGHFSNGSVRNQGSGGRFWSSTRGGNSMRVLQLDSSVVNPQGNLYRYDGYSVRCVSSGA